MMLHEEAKQGLMPYEMFSIARVDGDNGNFYGIFKFDYRVQGDILIAEVGCGYYSTPSLLPTENVTVKYPAKDWRGNPAEAILHLPQVSEWEFTGMTGEYKKSAHFSYTSQAGRGSGVYMEIVPMEAEAPGPPSDYTPDPSLILDYVTHLIPAGPAFTIWEF